MKWFFYCNDLHILIFYILRFVIFSFNNYLLIDYLYTFSLSISTFVGTFYIPSFSTNCVFTFSTMGIKGFAITSLGLSTCFPPISLKMFEASTTTLRFLSWTRDTFMISLHVVTTNLLFVFFFYQ